MMEQVACSISTNAILNLYFDSCHVMLAIQVSTLTKTRKEKLLSISSIILALFEHFKP